MSIREFSWRRWRSLGLFTCWLLFLFTACDGGCDMGCDGFSDEPYPEEHYNKTVAGSAEVRLTSHGLEFLSSEVDNLIGEFLDDGLSFCIPPSYSDDVDLCHYDTYCDDGSLGCQLDLSIDDAEIRAEAPNRLVVEIVIGDLLEELPATIKVIGSTDCMLELYGSSSSEPAQIPARAIIAFEIDNQSALNDTRVEIVEVTLDDSGMNYSVSGGLACSTYGWMIETFADGMVRDTIQDELADVVDDMSEEMLCRTCGDGDPDCPSNATCEPGDDEDDEPICRYSDGECVSMLLGIEGALEMGELVGDYVPRGAADIHLTSRLADRADAEPGLTLAMRSGFESATYTTCAPIDPTVRPSFQEIPPSPAINADVKPNGDPFMLGIGIHRTTIQHLLWSMWASGGLCLEVGGEDVEMLTTSAIGTLVDAVSEISTRQAPVEIRLSPQTMLVLELGDNIVDDDEVVDGLLNLFWQDLDIHMYGFVQERYARMFTLRVDLDLPIALVVDGDDGILPVLGDVEGAISNMRVINTELVDADVETFEELIPMLLGFALPELMDSLSDPIELPEFSGYRIVIEEGDITSVDEGDTLALFASLEYVGSEPEELIRTPRAQLNAHRVVVDRETGRLPKVTAQLDVGAEEAGLDIGGGEFEYLYRLNGGAWMLAGQGPLIELRHPSLSIQGVHELELRARRVHEGARWQRVPTATKLLVDYEAPSVEAWQEGAQILVEARDVVDRVEHLEMRYRWLVDGDSQQWSSWGDVETIELEELPRAQDLSLQLEVRDRAGHTAQEQLVLRQAAFHADRAGVESPTAGDQRSGCTGCGATGGGSGTPLVLLIALVGLIALRSRRKWPLMAVALVVSLSATACSGCGDDTAGQDVCEVECPAGEVCIDGECVVASCDDIDCAELECPDGQLGVCEGDQCVCQDYCAAGCEDDEFCCHDTNSCQSYPDWCSGVSCDDGYEPEITHLGDVDPEVCKVENGECECVAMPPIDLRYHGSYLSMDHGDGIIAVSVHNIGYGDLMVGIVDGDEPGVADWHFVDGVPETGVIAGDPDGPRGGIVTRGRTAGTHTATAVDDDGTIHVFYRHESNDTLNYARGSEAGGEWTFELTVVEEEEDTGYFSAVHLLGNTLHLVYNARLSDEESELRYRAIDVDLSMDDVSETEFAVLHTGFSDEEHLEDYLRVAGIFAQLVEYEDGLFLSIYDNTENQPGWLIFDGEQWSDPEFFTIDTEPYVSIRPDSEGGVHMAFMDNSIPALLYVDADGQEEVVIDGIRDIATGWSEMPVGHDVQLRVAAQGVVDILYHDASTHELRRAFRTNDGWDLETLAGAAGQPGAAHGLYVRRLSVDDRFLVADFSVDHTVDEEVSIGEPTFRWLD